MTTLETANTEAAEAGDGPVESSSSPNEVAGTKRVAAMSLGRRAWLSEKYRGRAGTLPNTLLIVALGVFLVTFGYARGREELTFGTPLYWTGQLLIFGAIAYRVLAPSTHQIERTCLVFVYAGVQSLIRWAYSPHDFTFIDEMQHARALRNVLDTGHLFSENYSLPISPRYPGLENIAAEFAQVTSLSPFASGVAIASISHVLTAACTLLLFREVSRSSCIASIAAILYMLNPHASYFNTSFLYEAPALPYAVLAILFAIRFATYAQNRMRYLYGLLACVALVVITHHVSALATVALLAVTALMTGILPRARHLALPLATCTVCALLVVAVWVFGVAPVTIEYLGKPVRDLVASVGSFVTGASKLSLPGPPTPVIERLIGPLGVMVTLVLAVGVLRSKLPCRPLEECWTWLALGMYGAASVIRVMVSSGAELAGRLLTYAAIFSALVLAIALARIVRQPTRDVRPGLTPVALRLTPAARLTGATALAVVLLVSSIVTSMPAWYQRVPGGFWIEGYAGGIDNVGVSRAKWADENLRPGIRFAGDITSIALLSTSAGLDPVKDPGTIYYSEASGSFTPEEIQHIKSNGIILVDVDLRMSQHLPIGERYFAEDVNSGDLTEPIAIERLQKFATIPGLSRIYDSGYAHTYDMRGGRNAPYAR